MKITFHAVNGQPQAMTPLSHPQAGQRTLADLVAYYLAANRTGQEPSTQYQLRCFYDWLVRSFSRRSLADLTPDVVYTWKSVLSQSYKPATVHKYLSRLDAVLKFGVTCGWVAANPMAQLRKPSRGEGRIRYLSDDERQRLLAACRQSRNPLWYAVVRSRWGRGSEERDTAPAVGTGGPPR